MRTTLFAGLTQLDPLDPLSTDDYSFQATNPDIIDRLLEIGAVTHRHDGHAALSDPTTPPVASYVASGGQIPGGVTFEFAVTLVDADRGETAASPIGSVTTPDLIAAPTSAPVAVADYTGGTLQADTYYYAATWVDAGGGETTLGAIRAVDVDPYPAAQVNLSGLTAAMPAGAVGWRLYRARGGEAFHFIWEDSVDTLTDDGSLCANCQVFPPEVNSTTQNSTLAVSVGHPGASGAVSWRLYGRTGGSWSINSFLASGTDAQTLVFRTWGPTYGKPPVESLSQPGASQIDPDTDLLDWHWKRPVNAQTDLPSGTYGDARIVRDLHQIWWVPGSGGAVDYTEWEAVFGNTGAQGPQGSGAFNVEDGDGPLFLGKSYLKFTASGASVGQQVLVDVSDLGTGSAGVKVTASGVAVPACRLSKSALQSVNNNTPTTVTFDGETFDEGAPQSQFSDAGDALVCRVPGRYLVNYMVFYAGVAAGTYRAGRVAKNGVQDADFFSRKAIGTLAASVSVEKTATIRLNVGDLITLEALHDRGVALDVIAGTWIEWVWQGP